MTYQGHAIAVEVDGAAHRHRCASDRTHDELLSDAGLTVYRIPVEDAEKPEDLVQHIERIVSRLARPR